MDSKERQRPISTSEGFRGGFRRPEVAPKLSVMDIVLKTIDTPPDAIILIATTTGEVPEVELVSDTASTTMTAETGNVSWQGKVNLPLAMAKCKIKVAGNVAAPLKLVPLGWKFYPCYIATLQADSRADIIT